MGHRLSKIYTRTGDDGSTGISHNKRLPKDHARIEAIGSVDELNAVLGLLLTESMPDNVADTLVEIQHRLFDLGGELSLVDQVLINESHVQGLEQALDQYNADLPPLKEFILPGGSRAAAWCHLARTVCRRAERRLCSLADEETVSPFLIQYTNRLSDLLFVLARYINKTACEPDVLWKPLEKKD